MLAALVKRGLAFRHPRPPHDHFLTRGRASDAGESPPGPDTGDDRASGTAPPRRPRAGGVFAARVGGEDAVPGDAGFARLREVRSAWQGCWSCAG